MKAALILATAVFTFPVLAQQATIPIQRVDESGVGKQIGTVTAEDSDYGLILAPDLQGLEPGRHGFHIHQNPSCKPAEKDGKITAGAAAGGHYDPQNTNQHRGPIGEGHLGDLPVLVVNQQGEAELPVIAPRLKLSDLRGHSLMVHAGGDNYADKPDPLGGGGARVACGVVPESS